MNHFIRFSLDPSYWRGRVYKDLQGFVLHEPELDKNNDIGDSDGDHRGEGASLNSEQTQAGHWSCLFQLLVIIKFGNENKKM